MQLDGDIMALLPILITQKTMKENRFSRHDNRHSFQNSGVYFGQGLGKRLVERGKSQHLTSASYWDQPGSATLLSTYNADYYSRHKAQASPSSALFRPALEQESWQLHKFHIYSKSHFRRFPRMHKTATDLPLPLCLNQAAEWFDHSHRVGTAPPSSLTVLAESQKPYLSHNPWVYSYRM